MKKFLVFATLFVTLLFGCDRAYDYKRLSDFQISRSEQLDDIEVSILYESGGPLTDSKTMYYHQYVVLTKEKDTVRVLAPSSGITFGPRTVTLISSSGETGRAILGAPYDQGYAKADTLVACNKQYAGFEGRPYTTVIGWLSVPEDLVPN